MVLGQCYDDFGIIFDNFGTHPRDQVHFRTIWGTCLDHLGGPPKKLENNFGSIFQEFWFP